MTDLDNFTASQDTVEPDFDDDVEEEKDNDMEKKIDRLMVHFDERYAKELIVANPSSFLFYSPKDIYDITTIGDFDRDPQSIIKMTISGYRSFIILPHLFQFTNVNTLGIFNDWSERLSDEIGTFKEVNVLSIANCSYNAVTKELEKMKKLRRFTMVENYVEDISFNIELFPDIE